MNFVQLQRDVHKWAHYNFGDEHPRHPLMGMMEEVGELAHAVLKKAQGIRGTAAEHEAAMHDAIGDIVIYMIDFMRRLDVLTFYALPGPDLSSLASEITPDVDRNSEVLLGKVFAAVNAIQVTYETYFCGSQPALGLGSSTISMLCRNLLVALANFCWAINFTLDACVEETWYKVVAKRNWVANSLTGEVG